MKKAKTSHSRTGATKKKKRNHHSVSAHAQRKKHHKPFRVRHVSLIVLALLLGLGSTFQLGVYYGNSRAKNSPVITNTTDDVRVVTVRSSYGFSFAYDNELLKASATETTQQGVAAVTESELRAGKPLISATLSGTSSTVASRDAAAQLSLRLNQDESAFSAARSAAPAALSDQQVAMSMFEVGSNESFDVHVLTQVNESLNGLETVKRVFQYTPKFGSTKSKVYSVQWAGVLNGRAFVVHLEGLVGDSTVPAVFQPVFDTLGFLPEDTEGDVLGLTSQASFLGFGKAKAQALDDKYIVDSVSPAVVKIYHATCGTLMVAGRALGGESCDMNTGSGFFVSSDGYIATNGHVVTHDAEDIFINAMLSNPSILVAYLKGSGLSDAQIVNLDQNPSILAALIAQIYDLPEDDLRIANESHTYFVALGEEALEVNSLDEAYSLRDKEETEGLVKATLVDTDYSGKDLYALGAGDEEGFSSSDVALLKSSLSDTPYIELFDDTVTQNMAITIVGFPADAENRLTDNSKLSTTVTNGTISAIRDSAGGKYKLYQSDADASGGNSGGPVLSSNGRVLGLLTYRFKSNADHDAAKSYIRAVEDLKALADENNVSFTQDGSVQTSWENGLALYSENRFSKANKEFSKVNDVYPAHRLVSTYVANADQAIAEGRDVKDFPVAIVAVVLVAVIGVGAGIVLAVRHRGHHQTYKINQQQGVPQSAASYPQPQTTQQSTPTTGQPAVAGGQAPPPSATAAPQVSAPPPQVVGPTKQPPQPPQSGSANNVTPGPKPPHTLVQ